MNRILTEENSQLRIKMKNPMNLDGIVTQSDYDILENKCKDLELRCEELELQLGDKNEERKYLNIHESMPIKQSVLIEESNYPVAQGELDFETFRKYYNK